jgi:phosphate transport system permease protein
MALTKERLAPFVAERQAQVHPAQPSRRPLRPRDFGPIDMALIAGAALSAYCFVWVVFYQLTLLSGWVGFLVCWLFTFLVTYWMINVLVNGRRMASDRVVAAVITVGALSMFTPLVLLIVFLVAKGAPLLFHTFSGFVHVLTATQKGVEEKCLPGFPCKTPGVFHAIVGTLEQIGIAIVIGVPAGVLTAIYLNEVGGRFTRWVRVVVTAMSGVPAILAGLFVYAFWVVQFHQGFSGFAGALALSVLLIPTVTRGTEEVLRIVPNDLREASTALAAPQWRTVWSVVLPTARSGLVTAVLLSIAVALGETAPLIVTIFGNTALNPDPFHDKQAALPLLSYTEVKSPLQSDINLAYTAALVLFMIIFIVFVLARLLASDWLGNKFRGVRNRRMVSAATRGVAGNLGVRGSRDS